MEQVAQGGSRAAIPGDVQGQAQESSEQPESVEGVPAYCVGLDEMTFGCHF